jgi:hypothetical protein
MSIARGKELANGSSDLGNIAWLFHILILHVRGRRTSRERRDHALVSVDEFLV